MPYVLPAGVSATLTDVGGANSITLNVTSITGATQSMAMAEITLLSESTLKRIPSRLDPGTVQFECYLDDTATVSNHLTTIKTRQTAKTATVLNLDFPGTTIDAIMDYTGYIMEVTDPQIALGDDVLRFSVTMQVTA
jgi:hypothetical protein